MPMPKLSKFLLEICPKGSYQATFAKSNAGEEENGCSGHEDESDLLPMEIRTTPEKKKTDARVTRKSWMVRNEPLKASTSGELCGGPSVL